FAAKTEDSNLAAGVPDEGLAQAEVAFGQPDPDQMLRQENIRWVHLNSAGYTRYERDDLRQAFQKRGATLTNSSSVYANPCAQHILAMMLSANRHLPNSISAQTNKSWEWRTLRFDVATLTGQTVLIVGYGAIARRLVELLKPFGAQVIATRRRPR